MQGPITDLTLLHQGLSEPEFYGDLVYKFKKIVGRADFSDQFRKIIVRYTRIGYNINTSSPKGNDRSPESNVPRSNLISKNSNSFKL